MRIRHILPLAVILLGISGCAAPEKYHWGNYERSLYVYYKNPAELETLTESLANVITDGEARGKVPPGIYAEYAYILYTSGKTQESIGYFEKERKSWPESSVFMEKMINTAKGGVKKEPSQNTEPIPGEGVTQTSAEGATQSLGEGVTQSPGGGVTQ